MIRSIIRDEQGSVIIENTITMWVFLLLTMGITQAGLIMWSAVGLEHGVEMAARCASVSDAAIDAGFVPSTTTPTPCYSTSTKGATNNQSTVKAYAVSQSWGVGVPLSAFTFPFRFLRLAFQPSQQFVLENADELSVLAAPFTSVLLCNEFVRMTAVLYLCCLY
jgi:hypothetical protein